MIIAYLIIGLLCLVNIKFATNKDSEVVKNGFFTDYLSVDKTNAIKGIFILIVMFSHIYKYLTNMSVLSEDILINKLYAILNYRIISQSMVSMFMLYSGYAVMLCCDKKGRDYVKSIPVKRVFKVLLHFDIAVLIYLAVQTILGTTFSAKQIVLSLLAWDSLGNENWYIFAILIMYLIAYVAFLIGRDNKKLAVATVFVLTVVYIIIIAILTDRDFL